MKKIALLLALAFIAACAQVPKQSSYPTSYQEKMQASEHWRVLAADIAKRVKLAIDPSATENTRIKDKIFISDTDTTTFGKAMRSFLASELYNQGMVPSSNPQSPYLIRWKVQEVYHVADRTNHTGLFVKLLDGFQDALLGKSDDYKKPHSEVIISYELLKNGDGILHGSQVYYVNDVDTGHYRLEDKIELVSQPSLSPVNYNVTNR